MHRRELHCRALTKNDVSLNRIGLAVKVVLNPLVFRQLLHPKELQLTRRLQPSLLIELPQRRLSEPLTRLNMPTR